MAEPLQLIETVRYKTYVKEALIEALKPVFTSHADTLLRGTKVTIDFPFTEAAYPSVVVRFYEREIKNAGIAHQEYFEDPNDLGRYIRYKHMLYNGDIEFAIYALSTLERDLISDSIVQTLTMGDIEAYTNAFLQRIYLPNPISEPASVDHMVNLNTDKIQGFGETQALAPWAPEDVMVYQTAYRIPIFGEFYSRTPPTFNYGLIEEVDFFPYLNTDEPPDPPWSGADNLYGTPYGDLSGLVTTGNTTIASPIILAIPSTQFIRKDMLVTGTGIPANTRVLSVDTANKITLTANASANGTGVTLTFPNPAADDQVDPAVWEH